jgi:DNA invertase Pin-like site-specific DNA recombinase
MITQKSIIYCRVSSERQKTEGHGLDSQEHRCRELADKKGYEVERVFRDSFSGGGDYTKRPAMSEMLLYMDSKPYNGYIVIFDDLKRLARDTEQYLKLKRALELRRAIVECPNFVFSSSPEGQYVETIMAATAQLEREQNRRQVMQKMKARLELGYWCFPDVPAGYEFKKDPIHGKLPVLISSEAKIIKEALEGFASGRFMEQNDVRKFLEDKKINKGKPVCLEYVKRMLTRIFYSGYIEYPNWEVSRRKAKHEALIDLTIFEKIQERLRIKTTTHVKNFLNEDFPLRGFVICNCCKQPITASWSKGRNGKFAYYRCKTNGCSERNKSIRKKEIESEFELILKKIKPSIDVLNLTKVIVADVWKKKELENIGKKNNIEREIESIESEKEKFMQLISRATDENIISTYEVRIGTLMEKGVVLKNSLMSFDKHKPNVETALDIVFDFLKNPLEQWRKGDIHTKKLVLKLVFEQNLAYNKNSGFETAILSLPLRVFTLPEAQNASLVEMVRIELTCK